MDLCISTPGHDKEMVNGLNDFDKCYIYQLMSNVQLPGFKKYIIMHSCTQKNDVSLDKQFQRHIYINYRKHGVIDQGKYRKRASK